MAPPANAELLKNRFSFLLHIFPAMLFISLFLYLPFAMNIGYSFTEWDGITKSPSFIGLKNFQQIFTGDPSFFRSIVFTIRFLAAYVVLINIISLFIAAVLDQGIKTKGIVIALFYVPYVISQVVVGYIWKFIFLQGFESLHQLTGLAALNLSWLGDKDLVFYSVVFVSIWQSVGFFIVIYTAGLQSIPPEYLEAAKIDGAGSFRRFYYISIPFLAPSITTGIFISLLISIKTFDTIFALTMGGPGESTNNMIFNIYKDAFVYNRYGYGTAKSLLLFLVVLVLTYFQLRFLKRREIEA